MKIRTNVDDVVAMIYLPSNAYACIFELIAVLIVLVDYCKHFYQCDIIWFYVNIYVNKDIW